MATAVCKAIKAQHPDSKIIVITGYPEVFEGNRKVYKIYLQNEMAYFWREHIEGQEDTRFFMQEPYLATDFIHGRGHLIKVWCEMNGMPIMANCPNCLSLTKRRPPSVPCLHHPNQFLCYRPTAVHPTRLISTHGPVIFHLPPHKRL